MFLQRLQPLRDETYAAFQRKLLPTLDPLTILGVRTPALRALAKQVKNTPEAQDFMNSLPHKTFEENQLHAFLIGEIPGFEEALHCVDAFLPFVDNWATCDQLRPRALGRNKEILLQKIEAYLSSRHSFTVRFGLEMLMCHFMDEDFSLQHLSRAAAV